MTEAKTAFEASAQRVRDAVAAIPGLTVLGISRTADKAWIANAGQHPYFAYLQKLGVRFVPAGGEAVDYFTEISYEQLDTYSADLIWTMRGAPPPSGPRTTSRSGSRCPRSRRVRCTTGRRPRRTRT